MVDDGSGGPVETESGGDGCAVSRGSACIISDVSVDGTRLDSLFEVLSSRRRRFVLYHLATMDDPVVEREALADAVLAHERRAAPESESPTRADVLRDLHHRVLPRLRADGFIDYDERHGTVRYDAPASFADCLSIIRELEAAEDSSPESRP